jgi:hypothetical protein
MRGGGLAVAEQCADDRKAEAARNEDAREAVAKVVQTNAWQFCRPADAAPGPLDLGQRLIGAGSSAPSPRRLVLALGNT